MAVVAYALDGMSPERAAELGIDFPPNYLGRPGAGSPSVGLYSDRLNQWSDLYCDDGSLTSSAWEADPLFAADLANQNTADLTDALTAGLASNITYLADPSPSAAEAHTQVAHLTRQVDALVRLTLGLLDTTQGA